MARLIFNPDSQCLHALLSQNVGLHIYEIGDLDPRFGWTEETDQDELTAAARGNITNHPDYRGRGYGRRVTAALCRLLREDGLSIGLNVHTANQPALRTYRSIGFVTAANYGE